MKKIYIIGLVIILIGGVFMAFSLNGNRAKHKEEFRERQERLALYLINNFELTNGEEIKEIKITSYRKNHMTGIWDCSILVNGKYYVTISEIYERKEIGLVSYKGEDFKDIKPPKNNNKLEANIEYFED
ncbi:MULTISPECIES: hypothetical protein [unclassified Parvimonas]|uniref:hypothetical protein n=1 Tax=unclassified Parvimonas TaxID=1151464 RepID=UPI002B4A5946|nr:MULTISPECIES: hypothetical protein [unclassified Parvimonas]MEB3025801.1 hypothetical protein [Parvimonas sp. M13]MEB3089935.1 hypothetical protein [Parvimonas sp. M20]